MTTDDCVFENTQSAPDGTRYTGQEEVGKFREEFFASTPQAKFAMEEVVVSEDRGVVRWRFDWGGVDTRAESGQRSRARPSRRWPV